MSHNEKLPKHIIMMIEKGNLVSAIRSLSSEQNISMDVAKDLIDEYELGLKQERQKQQEKIAQQQKYIPTTPGGIIKHDIKKPFPWKWLVTLIILSLSVVLILTYSQ